MNVRDCYRILNVPQGAGPDEIKSAFRKQAFRLHPDLNPSPNAADQFRKLNEAYVILTRTQEQDDASFHKKQRPGPKPHSPQSGPQASRAHGAGAYASSPSGGSSSSGQQASRAKTQQKRQTFHYKEEEVLSDLLKDPFARKVFEDIYSQIRDGRPAHRPAKVSRRSIQLDWGSRSFNLDLSRGVRTRVRDWFRRQLDDEQTLSYPAHLLLPGRTIRLDIRSRFAKPRTIEIRLPADFSPGRPIRLKNLGRSLGPFKGDLYLRIVGK
ncbi:molecular chaperone DnaJ [Paucidesulfovibrio gracilis DSM 16080]|uniref:Molecular chaperone DnaJ n=1 Tax=Paucidesulfovibrio gracilis DSM 16080 TaxID=1121449 RepID=A0A1T4XCK3_9BACT|nr:DnaJ domain-containing protein [Paucidesulfovibrio gracilis]SKA87216.1 molecular chaperone DnaJ [Paucidesulfovibrio gracilis DSM 16080]